MQTQELHSKSKGCNVCTTILGNAVAEKHLASKKKEKGNILINLQDSLKGIFCVVEKELVVGKWMDLLHFVRL